MKRFCGSSNASAVPRNLVAWQFPPKKTAVLLLGG